MVFRAERKKPRNATLLGKKLENKERNTSPSTFIKEPSYGVRQR